jgi:hypothetical protein
MEILKYLFINGKLTRMFLNMIGENIFVTPKLIHNMFVEAILIDTKMFVIVF